MYTDCLVYYRVDIERMWAHDAIRLIEQLPNYWAVLPGTDPPVFRSAVMRRFDTDGETPQEPEPKQQEPRLLGPADLARFGYSYGSA